MNDASNGTAPPAGRTHRDAPLIGGTTGAHVDEAVRRFGSRDAREMIRERKLVEQRAV
jgi:hypothetical protein